MTGPDLEIFETALLEGRVIVANNVPDSRASGGPATPPGERSPGLSTRLT